jgi:probable phosphoglycerate mutase
VTGAEAGEWPTSLWIVRHGESAGNVARDRAEAAGMTSLAIEGRDVDVPLSPLGRRQALALGRWFGRMPAGERPSVVLSSPYIRAVETATLISEAAGLNASSAGNQQLLLDERLREKELGMFNRLTRAGIVAAFPEQAALRARIGKFYHRPPSGESWCDVLLRLRSALQDMQLQHRGGRVLIVAHQVIVLCFRYLLEGLTEAQILAIDAQQDVANCGVTSYVSRQSAGERTPMTLVAYNFVAPLEEAGEPVTQAPDTPVAPR